MGIPERIDSIIAQRRTNLPLVEQLQTKLKSVKEAVRQLESISKEVDSEENTGFGSLFKSHPEIAEQLRVINTNMFNKRYEEVQNALNQLHSRFSRKEVHISFVGRAGQGKSLVMQNISGLSGKVIPSSDGSDCTGAKSIITNRVGKTVSAEIQFYSRSEYVNIINKYLREIYGTGKFEIEFVEAIEELKNKNLGNEFDISVANNHTLFKQLEKYIDHSDEVLPLLGKTITVPENEIESYVAQYCSDDKNKKYYKYLGVKVANILCSFPCSQCGKIVLVDTIGLGSTALDIREQMLETVSNDSDAILLMTRPDPSRPRVEQVDIEIVKDIGEKMSAEYTRRMLFWVLNKVSAGKSENIRGVKEVVNELKRMQNFPTADLLEVDCKESSEVENGLLIPVLSKLAVNIPEMDKLLIENARKKLLDLQQEYHAIVENVGQAYSASIDQDTRRAFRNDINAAVERMTNSIRDLYLAEPYGKLRTEPCCELKNAVDQKLRNIVIRIPEESEVLEALNNGSINQHNAYEAFTDKMRINIINDFLELNETLHKLVEDMKLRIVHCLVDDKNGRLNHVISAYPEDPDTWLSKFILHLESDPNYKLILEGVEKILKFDLRMESFLIYRVRNHLDSIDISLMPNPPSLNANLADKEALAKDIIFQLEHYLVIVQKEIKEDFDELYSYPNSAMWAVVRDFHDRIVYSKDDKMDVQTAWRYLYEDSIPSIWTEQYKVYQSEKGESEHWNTIVDSLRKLDNNSTFSFN